MASAASAASNGDAANTLCVNAFESQILGVNMVDAACHAIGGANLLVTGPQGPTGPVGPTGAAGAVGAVGGTGLVGNHGTKGAQGATGAQGAPAPGPGAAGPAGPQGVTGPQGPAATGAFGGTGTGGAQGVPGPQGATGPVGPTGATAVLDPVAIEPGCTGLAPTCNPATGALFIPAGAGKLGNTTSLTGASRIILTCPAGGTLISGGANLLPADVSPGSNVRGILESSFPNPANPAQWFITAEVTQTSTNSTVGPPPGSPNVIVDPYVTCRF
jgi:hypothetical protein